MTTDIPRPRGRPRRFDPDEAVATAQSLFHARGYDAVSVADLTAALGINPPSFYAAFGSKAGLYARVVERYGAAGTVFLEKVLSPDRPVADALAALLEAAARFYSADPVAPGCLVIEGVRCNDAQARETACTASGTSQDAIHAFVASQFPDDAARITDYVGTIMAGLSAMARAGHGPDRLLATARLAGTALALALRNTRA
ncbi:TetR/AcrR family transcriptional regulator [Aureimonas psammosilenae]|uniref:TetR/AcrR family transcriptional regulator n=1 Tax=Aureimonas psammosilenae TaxID=2495496 RepID=UPI0012603F7C|nr:helix-turn-helix domain-containing protein [Aureimonas psammosilenae]